MPTALERTGNFSQTLVNGQPVQIFNPATGLPFPNATIPQNLINSASLGLLNYIPMPNLPGTTQNFQYITAATNNSTDLNFRLNQALGGSSVRPGSRAGTRTAEQPELRIPLSQRRSDPDQCVSECRRTHHYELATTFRLAMCGASASWSTTFASTSTAAR